jgi:hypothetical protein
MEIDMNNKRGPQPANRAFHRARRGYIVAIETQTSSTALHGATTRGSYYMLAKVAKANRAGIVVEYQKQDNAYSYMLDRGQRVLTLPEEYQPAAHDLFKSVKVNHWDDVEGIKAAIKDRVEALR